MKEESVNNYESDLVLGEKYRDRATGVVGHLTAIHFYEHACERASLRFLNGQGEVCTESFDAPELIRVSDDVPVGAKKPGGPKREEGRRV